MASADNLQDWEVYYKQEHKLTADMKENVSIENYVIMLFKKVEVSMGFKFVMRNVKNDLDFYSAHVIAPMYADMKRLYNLYSDFPTLHKNIKMILEANRFDSNHVIMQLKENEDDSIHINIIYNNGTSDELLFVYPMSLGNSYDVIYFLKREMEFEANMGKHHLMRSRTVEKELDRERAKNQQLVAQLRVNCDKVTELEARAERTLLENYHIRMRVVEMDNMNRINFRHLITAQNNIKQLHRVINELRAELNNFHMGIPHFMRAVHSLMRDVENVFTTPMPRDQLFQMLDIFSTGVLELAKVGNRLTRIMAARQEYNGMNTQFRSAVLAQTRLITIMQDLFKGRRLTGNDAVAIRRIIEKATNEIFRKFGNRHTVRHVHIGGNGVRCIVTTEYNEVDDDAFGFEERFANYAFGNNSFGNNCVFGNNGVVNVGLGNNNGLGNANESGPAAGHEDAPGSDEACARLLRALEIEVTENEGLSAPPEAIDAVGLAEIPIPQDTRDPPILADHVIPSANGFGSAAEPPHSDVLLSLAERVARLGPPQVSSIGPRLSRFQTHEQAIEEFVLQLPRVSLFARLSGFRPERVNGLMSARRNSGLGFSRRQSGFNPLGQAPGFIAPTLPGFDASGVPVRTYLNEVPPPVLPSEMEPMRPPAEEPVRQPAEGSDRDLAEEPALGPVEEPGFSPAEEPVRLPEFEPEDESAFGPTE